MRIATIAIAMAMSISAFGASAEVVKFSADGRMGYYSEFFLVSVRDRGRAKVAKIMAISNMGEVNTQELTVDCNPKTASVSGQGSKVRINPRGASSGAEQIDQDIWFMVCRNRPSKFLDSNWKRPLDNLVLQVGRDIVRVDESFSAAPTNIVTISVNKEPAVVYCSSSVPTVYWNKANTLIELSDLETAIENHGKRIAERSRAIWKALCKPMRNP